MFAVKGWSIKAERPKAESASAPATGPSTSKKRKRPSAAAPIENVTSSNIADLWERVIEQKEPQAATGDLKWKQKKSKKRQKLDTDGATTEVSEVAKVVKVPEMKKDLPQDTSEKAQKTQKPSELNDEIAKKEKRKMDKKERRRLEKAQDVSEKLEAKQAAKPKSASVKPQAPAPKLTPLQASMREKLISARFRHLNETLYTRPSAEAYQLFEDSPEMFIEYHEGFRRQVNVWPENPVDGYINDIKLRARQKLPSSRDSRKQQPSASDNTTTAAAVQPLPRNRATGTCTIADLGCGDARLASTLQPAKNKLRLEILSFDLHSPSPHVTKADIANIPMANGTVDVAIFCLALMGTNWIDFVEEAYRILRWKGELWVAEIKSRFGHVGSGKKGRGVVEHSVGNRRNPEASGKKQKGTKASKDAELNVKELAVEVDGAEDNRQQTDVSAFVAALQKRGFVLHGETSEAAVDLSNKMFVKLRFLKAAPAIRGKNIQKEPREHPGLGPSVPPKKPKFIDVDEDMVVNESAILKPCVYKLR